MMPESLLRNEALDRTHLVSFILAEHLRGHPYIVSRPDLVELCEKVGQDLMTLYQSIAAEVQADIGRQGGTYILST